MMSNKHHVNDHHTENNNRNTITKNNAVAGHGVLRRPGEYKRKRREAGTAVVHEFVSLLYKRIASPLQLQTGGAGARRDSMTLLHQQERLYELLGPKFHILRDTSCSSTSSASTTASSVAEPQMTFPSLSMVPSREAIQWYFQNFSPQKSQENGVDRAKHFAQACLARPLMTQSRSDICSGECLNVMAHNLAASLVRLVRADFAAAAAQPSGLVRSNSNNKRRLPDVSCVNPTNLPNVINVESAYVSFVPLPDNSEQAEEEEQRLKWPDNDDDEEEEEDGKVPEEDEGLEFVTVPIDCSMSMQVSLLYQNLKKDRTVVVPVSLETTGFVVAQVRTTRQWISNVELAVDTEKIFTCLRQQARIVVAQSLAMAVVPEEEGEDEADEEEECSDHDEEDDDEEKEQNRRMSLPASLTKKQKTVNPQL